MERDQRVRKNDGLPATQHKFPTPGVVSWDRYSLSALEGEADASSAEGVPLLISYFWDQGLYGLSLHGHRQGWEGVLSGSFENTATEVHSYQYNIYEIDGWTT